MLAEIGLVLIIAGWAVQIASLWKKKREIKKGFAVLYGIGVALLAVDGFMNGLTSLALLNIGCFISAALVLLKIPK